jgi:hypothetical protein
VGVARVQITLRYFASPPGPRISHRNTTDSNDIAIITSAQKNAMDIGD